MKAYKENVKQLESIRRNLKSGYYSMAIIDLEFLLMQLKRELKEMSCYKIAEELVKK